MSEAIDPIESSRILLRAWEAGDENLATDEMLTRAGIPLDPPPEWKVPGEP